MGLLFKNHRGIVEIHYKINCPVCPIDRPPDLALPLKDRVFKPSTRFNTTKRVDEDAKSARVVQYGKRMSMLTREHHSSPLTRRRDSTMDRAERQTGGLMTPSDVPTSVEIAK